MKQLWIAVLAVVFLAGPLLTKTHGERLYPDTYRGWYVVDRWGMGMFHPPWSGLHLVDNGLMSRLAPYLGEPVALDVTEIDQQRSPGMGKMVAVDTIERLDLDPPLRLALRVAAVTGESENTPGSITFALEMRNDGNIPVSVNVDYLGLGVVVLWHPTFEDVVLRPGKSPRTEGWDLDCWVRSPFKESLWIAQGGPNYSRWSPEEYVQKGTGIAMSGGSEEGFVTFTPGAAFEAEIVWDGLPQAEYQAYLLMNYDRTTKPNSLPPASKWVAFDIE